MAARDLVRPATKFPWKLLTVLQYYAYNQFMVEEEVFGGSSFLTRFKELLTVPRIRRATMGGAIVMTAQQFSGINIMVRLSLPPFQARNSMMLCIDEISAPDPPSSVLLEKAGVLICS